ncbi:hypothetical protein [Flavobacterium sp.]|uniref:hypothetical protein n=1 Tax=Flavobacterium sp. TaxID=239 RepID=UPI001205FEA8|nr:hypothetical protein [Flavobacterium sp.]RZJ71089.1 MAG: hypothetical protein EOO49_11590 [Flavobacterium sp.]
MTALYVLGNGSPFLNSELLYSLRTLERHALGIDRVVVVGEKPNFIDYSKVVHAPFKDTLNNKEYSIASKIYHACEKGLVDGDFFFCNDDFFFTQDFLATVFPFFQKGALYAGFNPRGYDEYLKHTRDFLIAQKKEFFHFDVHTPIIYNSEKFIALKDAWEYSRKTIGLVVKSTYCNMYGINGPEYKDVKLKSFGIDDYHRAIESPCFSIYDSAWKAGVFEWLKNQYPNKSKWEL